MNEITGRRTAKKGIIKVKDKEDRINEWYTDFKELLADECTIEGELDAISPILWGMGIVDSLFTEAEYTAVKKSIKEGRTCRHDGISARVLKQCDLDNIILAFANKLLDGDMPEHWSDMILYQCWKLEAGDLGRMENYRGISLSRLAAKFVNKWSWTESGQKSINTYDPVRMGFVLDSQQQHTYSQRDN